MSVPRQLVMIVAVLALNLLAGACRLNAQSVVTSSEWIEDPGGLSVFQNDADAQHKVKVSGVVVNSITGAGVMKALVQIQGRRVVPVFTGADGRFEFDNLPEGQYSFTVRKPGYFSEQDLDSGMVTGPVVAESGQNMAEVRLKLTPEATVAGRVVDGSGEPIESATVQLMIETIENGRKKWRQSISGQTDENGEYSVTGVRPGDYALRGSASGGTEARLEGQNYDNIYLPQYYAGAPSRDQATTLHISGGQVVQADLMLKKTKGYRIAGEVTAIPPGQSVSLVLGDPADSVADAWAATGDEGRYTLRGVAPGAYTIQAVSQGSGGQSLLFGEASVDVEQGDVKNVEIGLQPAFHIPVQVEVTETHAAERGVAVAGGLQPGGDNGASGATPPLGYLNLVPAEREGLMNRGGAMGIALQPSASATEPMELKNVLPGKYRVAIALNQGANGALYVDSARAGDADLLTSELTVSETNGSLPIRIGLRDDGATLDITVTKDPSLRMAALLITSAAGTEPMFLFTAEKSRFSGLAPGDYRVYAFDNSGGLEYANPEALREFVGKSQAVSLTANQSAEVTVDVIHRGGP